MAEDTGASPRWNVGRGLIRLFIVLASCWYIAAGVVLWPRWATAIQDERSAIAHSKVLQEKYNDAKKSTAPPAKPSFDESLKGQSGERATEATKGMLDFAEFLEDHSRESAIEAARRAIEAANLAVEAARSERPVRLTVLFLLTPPIALGFAAALFWALRGFRGNL